MFQISASMFLVPISRSLRSVAAAHPEPAKPKEQQRPDEYKDAVIAFPNKNRFAPFVLKYTNGICSALCGN